jgi:hypothetical protein
MYVCINFLPVNLLRKCAAASHCAERAGCWVCVDIVRSLSCAPGVVVHMLVAGVGGSALDAVRSLQTRGGVAVASWCALAGYALFASEQWG